MWQGPELKEPLWGKDELAIRSLFEDEKHLKGVDSTSTRVVVLDEADAMLARRVDGSQSADKHCATNVTRSKRALSHTRRWP